MPRINPLPIQAVEQSKRILELRKRLRLSRVEFGNIIGMDSTTIANFDYCRSPWKPEKTKHMKAALLSHYQASMDAIKEAFA